jgi:hypothetical protein
MPPTFIYVTYKFIFLQVCGKCMLRDSCKFVNQNVWKCDANNLDVELVMNVIISYALHWVHPRLIVSDEVNKSVDHLLNEFVKLSQITWDCFFSHILGNLKSHHMKWISSPKNFHQAILCRPFLEIAFLASQA